MLEKITNVRQKEMERQIKICKQTSELINAVAMLDEAWDAINDVNVDETQFSVEDVMNVEDYTKVRNSALELVKNSMMYNLKIEGDTITI